jgi:NitT/TauT family transport system substrate-binding protein
MPMTLRCHRSAGILQITPRLAKAKRIRDQFYPKTALDPDKIVGLDVIVHDAVDLKFTPTPLTKQQLADLIQISPR